MKKFYTLYIVLALIICFFYARGNLLNDKNKTESKNINETVLVEENVEKSIGVDIVADEISDVEVYTIRSDNSDINVYNSDNEIIRKLNIDYNSLREYDKKQFDDGIVVKSLEEVYHIAEDFSG